MSAVLETTLDFALMYAQAGFLVFPLKPRSKVPCTEHGVVDATTDEAQIRSWWQSVPEANVGLALEGLVVVDVDPRNGGDCDEWQAKLPDTCCARTGGGGLHLLFRTVNGSRYARLQDAPGIDIKTGRNQYIVVEPSIHPSGEKYTWLDESEPWGTKPAPAPSWLATKPQERTAQAVVQTDTDLLRDLRSALCAIPSDDRDLWVRVGLALKPLGDAGRDLWLGWSQTSANFDPADASRVWDSLQPSNIGYQFVFAEAQRRGWINPAKRSRSHQSEPGSTGAETEGQDAKVSIADFYAYLPDHRYIYRETREFWLSEGVNGCLMPVMAAGQTVKPSRWLDQNRGVEQVTWAPGEPELIEGKLLREGGFVHRAGVRAYNLYRAPEIIPGDARAAGRWRDHVHHLYPDEADEMTRWFAQRVQFPGVKINHALVLGGEQGIGKDTILEPVKSAIGHWNWAEISPSMMMGRFNGWARSVIARVSEVRDLGDVDRFSFYEHVKVYAAAPPDVLRIDEKNLREYSIPNVLGLVMTTNYSITGLYLPPDDRRHFVAVSCLERTEFEADYFKRMYAWFQAGGYGHVAAYLRSVDLSGFDPKAPPRQTEAHKAIVMANTAPEEGELADLLEALNHPDAVSLSMLRESADTRRMYDLVELLDDKRRRRVIPHRMGEAGYDPVANPDRKDGLWWISGRRGSIYGRRTLPLRARIEAARGLCG